MVISGSSSDRTALRRFFSEHPRASLWQSEEWERYQIALGRTVRLYATEDQPAGAVLASALVVIDRNRWGCSVWETPRGPLWNERHPAAVDLLIKTILADARADRAVAAYFSSLSALPSSASLFCKTDRWQFPEATRLLDLTLDDAALLAQMKPKGRYNIRVAERHGITVGQSQDSAAFYALAQQTARRDGYRCQPLVHYARFLDALPGSFLLLAHAPGSSVPIAGLIGIVWQGSGVYYYGASDYRFRSFMAPALLQWEAMRYCRNQGCHTYDLFGIAPKDAGEHHPWQGITRFKEQFGGVYEEFPPEQMTVLRPFMHYALSLKRKWWQ